MSYGRNFWAKFWWVGALIGIQYFRSFLGLTWSTQISFCMLLRWKTTNLFSSCFCYLSKSLNIFISIVYNNFRTFLDWQIFVKFSWNFFSLIVKNLEVSPATYWGKCLKWLIKFQQMHLKKFIFVCVENRSLTKCDYTLNMIKYD